MREVDDDVELPVDYFDAVREISLALQNRSLAAFLGGLAPPHPEYAQLKALLAKYDAAIAQGGWQGTFSKHGKGREELQHRLSFEDDSIANDDDLTDAVEKFQAHHGLDANGSLDRETIDALNVPASQRVLEVEANMERWRWMPRNFEQRYVMVNVPTQKLEVVANGSIVADIAGDRGKTGSADADPARRYQRRNG